jgi:L-ascorbate metabolism protein UlaG (beta-lactamase superfamily)
MKITKFGQCCLLVEVAGKRILTDPGRFTKEQNELRDIDLILITHEHADHLHMESLTTILEHNPSAEVITNSGVGKLLTEAGIKHSVLEGRVQATIAGVYLEAYDGTHAEIFEDFGQVQNTGYFITEALFYPGDAYTEPQKPVPVLALPVGGPWCKIADAIRYALAVAPEKAFPVHDWLLNDEGMHLTYTIAATQLTARGIEFVRLGNGEVKEF